MVNYQFYVDEYHGGAISEMEWPAAEREASAKLEQYKRNYSVSAPNENSENMAVCAMAEVLVSQARADNVQPSGVVSSASIGSVSVSYKTPSESEKAAVRKHREHEVYNAARLYLDIYRGVG